MIDKTKAGEILDIIDRSIGIVGPLIGPLISTLSGIAERSDADVQNRLRGALDEMHDSIKKLDFDESDRDFLEKLLR